jgi:hypothetical protein
MLYEKLKCSLDASRDYKLLKLTHTLLDTDEGLSEEQFTALSEFVHDQVGQTAEAVEIFDNVDATDGRFYISTTCNTL